jgi:hypothetical protein
MAISHSNFNKRETILEPNLQKSRMVYRGPIPSGMINLFNDQFLLDINRLSEKIEILTDRLSDISEMTGNDMNVKSHDYYTNQDLKMTIYSQTVIFDEDQQEYQITQSTPHYNVDVLYNKFQRNSAEVMWLGYKLDSIESAMQKDI